MKYTKTDKLELTDVAPQICQRYEKVRDQDQHVRNLWILKESIKKKCIFTEFN